MLLFLMPKALAGDRESLKIIKWLWRHTVFSSATIWLRSETPLKGIYDKDTESMRLSGLETRAGARVAQGSAQDGRKGA